MDKYIILSSQEINAFPLKLRTKFRNIICRQINVDKFLFRTKIDLSRYEENLYTSIFKKNKFYFFENNLNILFPTDSSLNDVKNLMENYIVSYPLDYNFQFTSKKNNLVVSLENHIYLGKSLSNVFFLKNEFLDFLDLKLKPLNKKKSNFGENIFFKSNFYNQLNFFENLKHQIINLSKQRCLKNFKLEIENINSHKNFFEIIHLISRKEITIIKDLQTSLNLSYGSIEILCRKLVENGILTRNKKSIFQYSLTEKGKMINKIFEEEIEQKIRSLKNMSEEFEKENKKFNLTLDINNG